MGKFRIENGFTIVEPYDEGSLAGIEPMFSDVPIVGFGKVHSSSTHLVGEDVMFTLIGENGHPTLVGEGLKIGDTEYMLLRDTAIIATKTLGRVEPRRENTFGN